MPFLASKGCFWPPTAFMTSEVKNNYAYVIMEDICNKFIEVNFSVGCMVLQPNHLLQDLTTMSLIKKIRWFDEPELCQQKMHPMRCKCRRGQ